MAVAQNEGELSFNEENNIDDMYLTFAVAGEEYGIGIGYVTEIVGMQRVMEVPDLPAFIKGVINLRGKVIPVMDVRLRFSMDWKPYTERSVIIVLDVEGVPIGLAVDAVSDVREESPRQHRQSPSVWGQPRGRRHDPRTGQERRQGRDPDPHPPPRFRLRPGFAERFALSKASSLRQP